MAIVNEMLKGGGRNISRGTAAHSFSFLLLAPAAMCRHYGAPKYQTIT